MKVLVVLLALICATSQALAWSHGAPAHSSSVGMNLSISNNEGNGSTDLAFLNTLKANQGWVVVNGNSCTGIVGNGWTNMQTDANGYPTTMVLSGTSGCSATEFNFVALFGGPTIPTGEPFVQRGTYVLLYNGVGTITVTAGCSFTEHGGTGRDIYSCNEFGGSFTVHVTAINASTPIKDYALIYSPDSTGASGGNHVGVNETLYNNGPALTGGIELYSPQYIARVKPWAALRFMDAFQTNTNTMVNWSDRIPVGCYTYAVTCPPGGSHAGLPFEAAIALCNEVQADCWLNVPVGFTSSAATSYATLAHNNLNVPLRAIVESGNEYWLANFSSAVVTIVNGQVTTCGTGSILNQGIVNSQVVNDAWLAVYGADAPARLVRTLGGQSGNQGRNQFIMAYTLTTGSCAFTGTAASHATHFNAAPYWDFVGNAYPIAWSADPDPYLKFFEQVNGSPLVIPATTAASCTTGGTSIAFTASSNAGVNCAVNGSVPATPSNGQMVVVTFNQSSVLGTFTASVSGTVLTVTCPCTGTLGPGIEVGRVSTGGPDAIITTNGTGTGGAGTYNLNSNLGTISSTSWNGGTTTLAIDGGNAYPVVTGDGRTDDVSFLWITWSGRHIFCFTNANVDGITIATWRDTFGDATNVGTMPTGVGYYTQNYSDAMNAGLGLIGYESGASFVSGSLNPTRATWFHGAARDARMGLAELSYRIQLKSVGHGALTMQFNQMGPFTNFGDWSYMEGLLAPGSPRFNSVQNFK